MPPLAGFPSPPPPAAMAEMRFIVAQIGARHGYAVPAILDAAGLLERFYTDICGDIGWGRRIARARFVPGLRPRLSRLAGRRLPGAIRGRTRTFGWPACHHAWRAGRTRSDASGGVPRASALQRRLGPGDGGRRLRLGHARLFHARRMRALPDRGVEPGAQDRSGRLHSPEHRSPPCRGNGATFPTGSPRRRTSPPSGGTRGGSTSC